jgi:hypothetical protein
MFWHYVSVSDGSDLASELAEVFKRAGWNSRVGGISAKATHGISVDGGTHQDREIFIQALSTVGLSVQEDDSDEDRPGSPMDVVVGFKPPA